MKGEGNERKARVPKSELELAGAEIGAATGRESAAAEVGRRSNFDGFVGGGVGGDGVIVVVDQLVEVGVVRMRPMSVGALAVVFILLSVRGEGKEVAGGEERDEDEDPSVNADSQVHLRGIKRTSAARRS